MPDAMQRMSGYNQDGHELPSDQPIEIPAGFTIPETLNQQVARLVRHERFAQALGQGDSDTFEEADDFDVGDDFDPSSPFEQVFDPILQRDVTAAEFMANQDEYRKLYQKAAAEEMPLPSPNRTKEAEDLAEQQVHDEENSDDKK